jgi:hypothetical protein
MSIAADALRPFWLPRLNTISGKVTRDMAGWFSAEHYQMPYPILQNSFRVSVVDDDELLSSFACDCNRLGIAAFETVNGIIRNETFPRSTAWLVIQSYYAAFFAANVILRLLGTSCTYLDSPQIVSINRIAVLFGSAGSYTITKGYYTCVYDASNKTMDCSKSSATGGGTHEILWNVFYLRIKALSNEVLLSTSGLAANNQLVSAKLTELSDNLCFQSFTRGNWLSFIRNKVNYNHQFGTWYPYLQQRKAVSDALFSTRNFWQLDPMSITLRGRSGNALQQFQETCQFIICLCRALVKDMSARSPSNKSFLSYGPIAFLNLLEKQKST